MTRTCSYAICNSDQRYADKRDDMKGVRFIPFPKPKTKLEQCLRWIKCCGRQNFGVDNITKHTFVCTKHFVGGNGPTLEYPDPIPATATEIERYRLKRKSRKTPKERTDPTPKKRPRRRRRVNTAKTPALDVLAQAAENAHLKAKVKEKQIMIEAQARIIQKQTAMLAEQGKGIRKQESKLTTQAIIIQDQAIEIRALQEQLKSFHCQAKSCDSIEDQHNQTEPMSDLATFDFVKVEQTETKTEADPSAFDSVGVESAESGLTTFNSHAESDLSAVDFQAESDSTTFQSQAETDLTMFDCKTEPGLSTIGSAQVEQIQSDLTTFHSVKAEQAETDIFHTATSYDKLQSLHDPSCHETQKIKTEYLSDDLGMEVSDTE